MIEELKFWVVTRPTEHSVLDDIVFQVSPHELLLQGRGGLKPDDIVKCFLYEISAVNLGKKLLEERVNKENNVKVKSGNPFLQIFDKLHKDFPHTPINCPLCRAELECIRVYMEKLEEHMRDIRFLDGL